MTTRSVRFVALAALLAVVSLLVTPFLGMERITPGDLVPDDAGSVRKDIFWKIRVPRTLAAFLAGAALATAGMAFQAMFRNALATPFTLGASSGAAFGAALAIKAGLTLSLLGLAGQSASAFLWAAVSVALVYGLTRLRRGSSTATMLVAGVAVNFFFASLILFIQFMSDFEHSFRVVRWLMGGFEIVGFGPVIAMAPFVLAGGLLVFSMLRELDLFTIGEDLAASRGMDVRQTRRTLFLGSSLMVGGVVSICGPIGFIGMMSPHICRLVVGAGHRALAPASALFGGAFLVICDTLARTIIAPAEMPVGVVTALLGGPFFMWLLVTDHAWRGKGGRS